MKPGREPNTGGNRRRDWWGEAGFVFLLILLISLPRLARLSADPAPGLEQDILFDEGGWAHNARQHALFGEWVMDENNAGLIAAPLYTVALAGVYSLLGVGFVPTRLLTAVAGILCCLVFYAFLRGRYDRRRSAAVTLVLGCSYFMLTHNRVGYTDSFQLLFVLGAALSIPLAERKSGWAFGGGILLGLALLAKPSAVFLLAVAPAFWLLRPLAMPKDERRFPWRNASIFVGGLILVLALVLVVLVLPHWTTVSRQLEISFRTAYSPPLLDRGRLAFLGWEGLGLTLNGFFRQSVILILTVVLFAVARLGRGHQAPMDATELLCWVWLGVGLVFVGSQQYQPDRRFLFLMPPLAFLAVTACWPGGARFPSSENALAAGRLRRALAGALLGAVAGLYLGPFIAPAVRRLLAGTPFENPGRDQLLTLIWNGTIIVGAALLMAWPALFPRRRLHLPVAVLVAGFLIVEPIRFGWTLIHSTSSILETSRAIGRLEERLPPGRHTMMGPAAGTLALETDLFTFYTRSQERVEAWTNQDGIARYNPQFALVESPLPVRSWAVEHEARHVAMGFVRCRRFPLLPDPGGKPSRQVTLFTRPGMCPSDGGG